MQPFHAVGLTVAVPVGTPATPATGTPVNTPENPDPTAPYPQPNAESAVVLVSNQSTSVWGYFTAMDGVDDGSPWPPVFTTVGGVTTVSKPIPAVPLGVPVPPGGQILVDIAPSVTYYAAMGVELYVTPVEMLKTQ